jgi:hypothetical protein
MANESYTPDRGPRPFGGFKQSPTIRDQDRFVTPAKRLMYGANESQSLPHIKQDDRNLESSPGVDPVKQSVPGMKTDVGNSPPTLYSDAGSHHMSGGYDAGRMNNALVTPLVAMRLVSHLPVLPRCLASTWHSPALHLSGSSSTFPAHPPKHPLS